MGRRDGTIHILGDWIWVERLKGYFGLGFRVKSLDGIVRPFPWKVSSINLDGKLQVVNVT
jgi:hypothetical protein